MSKKSQTNEGAVQGEIQEAHVLGTGPVGAPSEKTFSATGPAATIGKHVHFVLPSWSRSQGQVRPAIVVKVHENGAANLQVFTDGHADGHDFRDGVFRAEKVQQDDDQSPGTWHWPVEES